MPSRGGIAPTLSLDYESGNGNGPFGVGWNLAPASVFRRTDKGVPRYQDDQESDSFIVAGADEVVRVLDERGAPVVRLHSLVGDLLSSIPGDAHYEVRPYRTRLETQFSRIEWWRKIIFAQDGARVCEESFWRIISRTNVTSLYGFSRSSRLAASDDSDTERIFQWHLERSFDDRGNAVEYDYASDDGEQRGSRLNSPRYLISVKYGNSTPYDRHGWLTRPFRGGASGGSPPWLFELALDYGAAIGRASDRISDLIALVERPLDKDRRIAPANGPIRPDSFASYRGGFEIRTRRLCRRILSYHHIPGGYEGLARSLELSYDENPYLSKIVAVTQVAWDGAAGKALPPLQLSYVSTPERNCISGPR